MGGVNYAALNAKVAGGTAEVARLAAWLPRGCVRDFVGAFARRAWGARGVGDYLRLWQRAQKLDKTNRHAMLPLLGAEIDLCNLIWLYRLRRFHHSYINEAALFGRLIPVRWRLTEEALRTLANARDADNLRALIADGVYGGVFASCGPDFSRPEKAAAAALLQRYKRTAMAQANSIAGVCRHIFEVNQW